MRFLLLILTLIYCGKLLCQSLELKRFYHITTEDGLPQSNVLDIQKTNDGFLWFANEKYLSRWDGYTFKVFYNEENNQRSLGPGIITDIFEDSNHRLWISTDEGSVNLYVPEKENFIHFTLPITEAEKVKGNFVVNLFEYKGRLYLATFRSGIYRFIPENNEFIDVAFCSKNQIGILQTPINKTYLDQDSNLWISTTNGVFKMKGVHLENTSKKIKCEHYLPGLDVYCALKDSRGNTWFGTSNQGVFRLEGRKGRIDHFPYKPDGTGLAHELVYAIAEDSDSLVWIGTGGAGANVYSYSNHTFSYLKNNIANKQSIGSNLLNCLYRNTDGDIWIGTFNNGISYTNSFKEQFQLVRGYGSKTELNNNSVLSFCEKDANTIWVGTDGGGINSFNKHTGEINQIRLSEDQYYREGDAITALHKGLNNDIWVGTYKRGLYQIQANTHRIVHYLHSADKNSISDDDIWDIESDSEGRLWLATLGGGLDCYDPLSGKFINYNSLSEPPFQIDDYLNDVLIDRQGQIWIASFRSGLYRFNPNSDEGFTHYLHSEKDPGTISTNYTRVLLEDSHGNIWVGTHDGGLNLYLPEKDEFISFNKGNGLPGNTIAGIAEDVLGSIWISTNKGIAKVVAKQGGIIQFQNYDKSFGLQGDEFNHSASYTDSEGHIYFGGNKGFSYFNPLSIHLDSTSYPVVFSKLKIFNEDIEVEHSDSPLTKSLDLCDTLYLSYKHSVFTLSFATLDYLAPSEREYKIKLDGFDREWRHVGNQNEVTFTNLDPGYYIFRVQGRNSSGIWSQNERRLHIYIRPPFWKTIWFKALLISLCLFTLAVIYRLRIHNLKRNQAILQSTVDQRTKQLRELNDELRIKNDEILLKSEELKVQSESLLDANNKLSKNQRQIQAQNQELEKHRHNLEELVRARTKELENAKNRAEESDQLKMSFLANMSHEIRTPMNAIMGFTSLLTDSRYSSKDLERFVTIIDSNGNALLRLIDDILDLSKIEANQLDLKYDIIDLQQFLNDVYINWSAMHQTKYKHLEYKLVLPEKINTTIKSDPLRLKQILNNLIDNAFKFTHDGSVELKLVELESELRISVCDSGIGIEDKSMIHIFDRFRTGADTESKLYRGVGLGLTISNKLAERLGMELSVESKFEIGSTFTCHIPQSLFLRNKA